MKYSTYLMVGALIADLIIAIVFLLVALAVRGPALRYDFYAFFGGLIFILIGMAASLGLTMAGYRRSMLAVSVIFNVVIAWLLVQSNLDIITEAVSLLAVLINLAMTAVAYAYMNSGREVPLPIIGA
ncbi:hypothetical protein [Acidilobus sp.]|uniref:hypothetical protein n=1 Tax=Acidilobus sp. TaxID=1872109 RepID=UPI003CFCC2E9